MRRQNERLAAWLVVTGLVLWAGCFASPDYSKMPCGSSQPACPSGYACNPGTNRCAPVSQTSLDGSAIDQATIDTLSSPEAGQDLNVDSGHPAVDADLDVGRGEDVPMDTAVSPVDAESRVDGVVIVDGPGVDQTIADASAGVDTSSGEGGATGSGGAGSGGAGAGGATGTGGATSTGGSSTGGVTGAGGSGTGGANCSGPAEVPGYMWHGAIQGYAFTAYVGNATGTPATFADAPFNGPFCITGQIPADPTYVSSVLLGVALGLNAGPNCTQNYYSPGVSTTGLKVTVSNRGTLPLRAQIESIDPVTKASQLWCAQITTDVTNIPWSSFKTSCWTSGGTAYDRRALAHASIVIPGNSATSTPFSNLCLVKLEEY